MRDVDFRLNITDEIESNDKFHMIYNVYKQNLETDEERLHAFMTPTKYYRLK